MGNRQPRPPLELATLYHSEDYFAALHGKEALERIKATYSPA